MKTVTKKKNRAAMEWLTMDLHIHTPASSDFQTPEVSYLDILQRAKSRGVDIIAITDHNTVSGYRRMEEEIQQLVLLEKLNRLLPEEKNRLSEYRRLRDDMLILPGFEFTATFGFHILGIFPPEKTPRELEHLLLNMRIPADQLDAGSATVGSTTDVLSAYQMINDAGGLVIAAHANSSNGIAMRGFPMGGQTKIAYTQDPYLHALEVTDLDQKSKYTTSTFFNGTKPEYPRRMHCIQGSDCHRLIADPQRKKNLGVGDRSTDVLMAEMSFDALKELFLSNDFARTRPHRLIEDPVFDFIRCAQDEGANIVQDFHESLEIRGGKRYAIITDICAFANTNGGTLYLGVSSEHQKAVNGINDPDQAIIILEKEINRRISPVLQCTLDVFETTGKKVIRVLIPRGDDPPYAVDDNKIYIRTEAETGLAVRDEIVDLIKRRFESEKIRSVSLMPASIDDVPSSISEEIKEEFDFSPRTGVEVVKVQDRSGGKVYTMRDLRNGNQVNNVTKTSARRLWQYAISTHSRLPSDISKAKITWQGEYGLLRSQKQGDTRRYDLVEKTSDGFRWYFGVTEDGIHGPWRNLVGQDDE